MNQDTYICEDMDDYVTASESTDLFKKKMDKNTKQKIINFIQNKVKKYETFTKDSDTSPSNNTATINSNEMITIPENIKTSGELRRWIYTYIKLCKYYTSKYSTANTRVMSSKNPVSIYEMIAKIFNHRISHDIYLKTHCIKKENAARIYGYTFHTISIKTFNDIVKELSLFVKC